MSKVSVIIPSRSEKFLRPTVLDLFDKANGDIEVIAVLDGGAWPDPPLPEREHLQIIRFAESRGMRAAINAGAEAASGEYLMKSDGHCMFGEGFDEILKADIQDNWVVVPRRKRLDPHNWCLKDEKKPDIDYMYLSYPNDPNDFGGASLHGRLWDDRNKDPKLKSILIDDLMSFQGSSWFMPKKYFYELELMDEEHYGPFANEAQEIGMKAWLSGGRVIVNKNTWYAHWHKGKVDGRGYFLDNRWLDKGARYTKKWVTDEAWDKQTLPFNWIVEKFWPIPGWPEDWQERLGVRKTEPIFAPFVMMEDLQKESTQDQILIIGEAIYGTDTAHFDVTDIVEQQITNNTLTLNGDFNALFGDPAPKKRKNLRIVYEYNGKVDARIVKEREKVRIP